MTGAGAMLRMAPVHRSERGQLYAMVDEYWQQIRPPGSHFSNDPAARAKYFDAEFRDEHESRFLWWAKLDETVVGLAKFELMPAPGRERLGHTGHFCVPDGLRGCGL